jgi:mycofactocin glycosyltransferase
MTPLSYRLSKGTRILVREDGVHLVLRYPLKAMVIHLAWAKIFEHLATKSCVPLTELAALQTGVARKKIAEFMNQMVFKGFLEREGADMPDEYPLFSIIIAVRNRPAEIDACLKSLKQLEYPADKLEIIVVDDASSDSTRGAIQRYPVCLISLKQHKKASFCRNLGARQAKGEILAFIDSDCMADPAWLKQLLPAFDDPQIAAVGGRVDAYYDKKSLDRYEKAKSSLMVSSYAKRSDPGDAFFYVPACNFLVRRNIFLEVGGFNEQLTVGEDVDLCWRLQKKQYDLEFLPEGSVYHKHRNQLGPFCKRRFDYGTSEPLLQKLHQDRVKQFLIPPAAAGFWALLILWAFTEQSLFGGLAGLVAIADSLVKNHRYKDLEIGLGLIFWATLRGYAAFFYHLCAFVSRYYLILGLVLAPFAPVVALVVGAMHLLNGVVEANLKKARMALPLFLIFFTLEQISYQAGVWWGCFCHRILSPVLPKLVMKISSK